MRTSVRPARRIGFALAANGLGQGALGVVTPLILRAAIDAVIRRRAPSTGTSLAFGAALVASEVARRWMRAVERRHARELARALGRRPAAARACAAAPAAACGLAATIFLLPRAGLAASIVLVAGVLALVTFRRRTATVAPAQARARRRALSEVTVAVVPAVVLIVGGVEVGAARAEAGRALAAFMVARRTASPLRRLARATEGGPGRAARSPARE